MTKRILLKYSVYLILSVFVSGLFFVVSLGCALGAVESMGCSGFAGFFAIPFNILLSVGQSLGLYPFDYDWILLTPIIFIFICLIEKFVRFLWENKIIIDLKKDSNG